MLDYEFTGKLEARCAFCNEKITIPHHDELIFDEEGYTEIVCDKCGETLTFTEEVIEQFNIMSVTAATSSAPSDETTAEADAPKRFFAEWVCSLDGFTDTYGWKNDIARLEDDEIYSRYCDDDWSDEYRQLCYDELLIRGLLS